MSMSRNDFHEYAAVQVAAADEILARHRPDGGECCVCGHPLPCSHAESIADRRSYFAAFLERC